MEKKIVIDMKGIRKSYYIGTENELEVLKGIDITVYEGEFVAIVGASGSGKSTLMNIIGSLDRPTSGSYILEDVDITAAKDNQLSNIRNQKIGFVFQTYNLISKTNAIKNVEMPMLYGGVPGKQRIERAKELLKIVGMGDRMKHLPEELSGGQKQRVAIAGIIAMEPKCIVLDEPTAMLDPKGRREVMQTITQLNRDKGITVILITHHMDEAAQAQRVIVLHNGKVADDGTPAEVFSKVENMHKIGLASPQTVELCYELNKNGFDLPLSSLDPNECAQILYEELKV